MSYRKLKKEEITAHLEESKDGGLLVVVGMYEKNNWRQYVGVRLINFPENCESLEDFRFVIDGSQKKMISK
jgi:hypothetical protein